MRSVKPVKIRNLTLDGKKIYIQSMLNASSGDSEGNARQAQELEKAGCDIIRVSVPDKNALRLIPAIKEKITVPLVADIHFDYRLALESAAAGIDKIRINPGNIGGMDKVKLVADTCRAKGIPIRIGVNSGSLEKEILEEYGRVCAGAMVKSAQKHIHMLEKCGFEDIVISIKSSNVKDMIEANRMLSEKCPYPLHLGVTEAGTEYAGIIKSAVGIGSLLCDGIGETIRVSLTADPVEEVYAAKEILKAAERGSGVKIISCPTCGRTRIDLIGLAKKVEEAVRFTDKDITVAVMGCAVNGPGEAKEADIGIAGGDGCALLFKKGVVIRKLAEDEIFPALICEINAM